MKKLTFVKTFESFILNEKTFYGGVDPETIYKYLQSNGKDSESYGKVKNDPKKELYLADLLETNEGREIMSKYSEGLIKMVKELELKVIIRKAEIDHPKQLLEVYNTFIKTGLFKKEDLIAANVFSPQVLQSNDWSVEVIKKIDDNSNTLATMVQTIKSEVNKK